MSSVDLTAVIGANTDPAMEAIKRLVAKPYKLNLSVGQDMSGALGRIRSQLGEFDKSLAASNARVLAFSASAGAMFAVTKSLREMVRVTVDVERKMTSINSILGAGRTQFKQFGNDLFKIARDTSTSFEEVADAAEELARQGVGIEETLKRTSSAMKLAKVSGVEVRTAVDAITAALNSNNDAWLDSEKLINKLVAVDAKFAVSAGGLAEAIKRVGSVASDAGLDIDELVAAITSAQQTTARGEAVIGNALKTIFTRAQRPKVLEDFESLGIVTKKATGENKSLSDVLIDVAKRYDDLSSAQQQSVSEMVGGVYQINILKALFRDLGKETSFFGSALNTSRNATNEADRRIAELNETLDSLFKKLTANLTQVGSGVGNDVFGPLFKNLLKGANAGLEQVNRELNGENGQIFSKMFEGIFKGIGNTLNSPILIGGFITIARFMVQTAREGREAIKTLAGLNNSLHSLEIVTADAGNWLRQNPKYLQDIVIASKSAEGATRALAAATAAYNKEKAQQVALDATIGSNASAIARAATVISVPGRGGTEKLQVKKAAVGLIPQVQEMTGAYAGGYEPGQVKDMNVPGMGRVYYNTAEKVKWFPEMEQPAIMPPQSSRAGRNYERDFSEKHGFNPYMSGGLVPNFNNYRRIKLWRGEESGSPHIERERDYTWFSESKSHGDLYDKNQQAKRFFLYTKKPLDYRNKREFEQVALDFGAEIASKQRSSYKGAAKYYSDIVLNGSLPHYGSIAGGKSKTLEHDFFDFAKKRGYDAVHRFDSLDNGPVWASLKRNYVQAHSGLIPNFSKDIFHSSPAGNALVSLYGKTAEILGMATNAEGTGGSKKIYQEIFEKVKSKGIKTVTGKLQRQDRYPKDDSDVSAVKAMIPQVTRARFGKYSILGVGNTEVRLNAKTFDKDLAKNAALIRAQMDEGDLPFLSTYLNKGLVPNFAPNPALQKAFTERFYRTKRGGRYARGEFKSEGEKTINETVQELKKGVDPLDQIFKGEEIYDTRSTGRKKFLGLSYLPETPTTVSGSINAITSRAPDEVTKRQLLRLTREFDYGVSSEPFLNKKYFAAAALGEKSMIAHLEKDAKIDEKYGDLYRANAKRRFIPQYEENRRKNVDSYLAYRKERPKPKSLPSSDYLFRGVSLDEITNLRRLGQVTSLGASNADDLLGTFITSSFGKAAGFGAATLKESGQGYVLALDKKRVMGRPTAESRFGSEEKNTIKAGRIEKDDVLGVVDLKTRQLRRLEEFAARNEETKVPKIPLSVFREEYKLLDSRFHYKNSSQKSEEDRLRGESRYMRDEAKGFLSSGSMFGRPISAEQRVLLEMQKRDAEENLDPEKISRRAFENFTYLKRERKKHLKFIAQNESENSEVSSFSRLRSILSRPDSDILSTGRHSMSRGLIPNFSPLSSAISRESQSVNSALIRVGSHSSLRGPGNPDGVGVYNLRDEPLGLGQGVERAKSMGLNPKTHGIPNYADGPFRKGATKLKNDFFGDASAQDPGNKFYGAMALSMAAPLAPTFFGEGKTTKATEEALNALSLGFTLSTFLRGPKGKAAAIGIAGVSGFYNVIKQATNNFTALKTDTELLKDNLQKASNGLNVYATTLESLQNAYLNNNISAEKIGILQNKLADSLAKLPTELRQQLIGAKSGGQVQNIIGKYSETQEAKLQEKEFALGLNTLLNEQFALPFSKRGLISPLESGTKTGEDKLNAFADILLNAISKTGMDKVGGSAGLGRGDLVSVLRTGGLSESTLGEVGRVKQDQLDKLQARMVERQSGRESDIKKFQALAPQRQREIEQAQMLEKRMKGARDTIKQAFEQIGQMANLRISIAGRRGLMGATGIGEQIQGTAGLIGETGSPEQAALASYKAQIAQNQIQAASGISNVFGGLRGGISSLYSNTDLSRMGDIPARMRAGQGSLMNILGGSSVSGIGEDAISLFKSLGKDDDVGEIKKLMADSNEKLVEIYQTLEEQNKLAEMQKNIALQRIEFERTLKVGGGLGSFMDRGVKAQQLGDIYSGKFGLQTGIFSGQGSIDLMRAFLGAGGKTGGAGFNKLMGVATESRAQDIISTQRDLNNAFSGTGLSLDVPSLADARKIAETQIAAELKTGDSAMEKQMAQLQAALSNTLSSTMGGQLNSAAQIFGNVLAGSSVFANLNSTIDSTQKTLQNLDATLKSLQGGGGYGVRAGGNIPISAAATEKMMAKAGGYNPGYIRRAGNLIYNSAERVDYLPGVREPVISPPPGSLAGFLHKQNLNAALGFAAGGSSYGNYTRFDPNLKYLVQPSMGDPLTLEQRARARKAGYELLTPEDRAKMLANQKRFRGGKYNITDLTADFREGSEIGRRLPNRLASSFSISTPTDLGFGGNKFIESQRLSGFEKSLDLEEFIKRKNLVRKAFGEQLLDINRPSSYANILEKELGSAYYLKPKDGAQGVGVLGNSQLSSSSKIKGKNYFAQRAISNMSGGEFRVTAVGGKYGTSVADIGYKRTAKGLIGNAFYELADDPTKGKTVGEKFDQFLSKTIAKAQAKRALASLPPQMRAGAVAGLDVAETGTKGVKKFLQAASEVTDIGREMFKGAGGVIEANLSDPTGYSGSLAKPSTNLKTAKLYSRAVNKNVLDKIIQSKGFQKTASVAGGVTKGVVNPLQILADTSVELGSRYAGAFAGRQKGVGAHKFDALSDVVGQTYLEERIDQLNEPGSDAFFGLSPGSWLRYGLTNESLGLMESYGDVEVAKKKYTISRDKKLKRQAFRDPAYSASRGDPFTPGITYQDTSEHNKMLSSVAKGVASSTVTEGPNAAMQTIGNLKNWRNSLNPMDQRRGLYDKEIRDRSVQSNAETIAKMFGISDPKQMQRLQIGVQNAMDKGNLQGYVKSLGKPVAAGAPAAPAEESKKQAAGNKSELTVNVNMGGNLGVKNAGVEFSEEQYTIINAIVAKVAEGIDEKVKAILRQQPAEVRSNVAASSPPTNPGGNFRGTPYGV